MLYAILVIIVLAAVGLALYAFLNRRELLDQISSLDRVVREQDEVYGEKIERLKRELAKWDKFKHIPNLMAKSQRLESEIAGKLQEAQRKADGIINAATQKAERFRLRMTSKIHDDAAQAKEDLRIAKLDANGILESAKKEAKELVSQARKEAKGKTQKVDETLSSAVAYALEIRQKAKARAREIGGEAYEALRRHEFYDAAAKAAERVAKGYPNTYLEPSQHVLDELAYEYGFHKAGERLKIVRDHRNILLRSGAAVTSNYQDEWKRNRATIVLLSINDGKVDSILARVKPAKHAQLVQEITDAFALANREGIDFRARGLQKSTATRDLRNSSGPWPCNG